MSSLALMKPSCCDSTYSQFAVTIKTASVVHCHVTWSYVGIWSKSFWLTDSPFLPITQYSFLCDSKIRLS